MICLKIKNIKKVPNVAPGIKTKNNHPKGTEFNSYKPSKNTFWEKDNSCFYYGTKALVSK